MNYAIMNEDICFTQEGYTGDKDYDDMFLGHNRTLPVNPIVTLSASMSSTVDVEDFFVWFDNEIDRGTNLFLIKDTTLFGKNSTYGVRFISKVTHSVQKNLNKIKIKVEVLYDADTSDNKAPIANPQEIYVGINSENNAIKLSGADPESDSLTFSVTTQPTKGDLVGDGASRSYIPYEDEDGEDFFMFVAEDYFHTSQPAKVTIVIGQDAKAEAEFEYIIKEGAEISGNFYYDKGDSIVRKGKSSIIIPKPTDVERNSVGTYTNEGILKYAVIDEARWQGANLLIEDESTNLALYSDDVGGTGWGLNYVTCEAGTFAPDGIKYYNLITATADGKECRPRQDNIEGLVPNEPFTLSFFAKKTNSDFIMPFVRGRNEDGSSEYTASKVTYQFSTDTFTPKSPEHIINTYSEKLAGGSVRLSITYSGEVFQSYAPMTVYLNLSKDGISNRSKIGDSVEYFGFQIEQGGKSSYIVTEGTQEVRARDIPEGKLTVWSNDHTIVNNENVKAVVVNNWGEREYYEDFFSGYPNIGSITFSSAEGTCKGKIFNRMFQDFPILFPSFNTSQGVYFQSFAEGYGGTSLPFLDLEQGIYFQGFAKKSEITATGTLGTTRGQYMQEFFMSSKIICCKSIDTREAINKTNMFADTSIVNPNESAIVALMSSDGALHTGEECAITLEIMPKTYTAPLIQDFDSTGLCSGTYEAVYSGTTGATTVAWTSIGGTIVGSTTDDIVTVEDYRSENTDIYLMCTVTTATQSVSSGDQKFVQRVTYNFLIMTLPKRYELINLRDEIDLMNTGFEDVIVINDKVNCSAETGDLVGLNVKLKNTGEFQGFHAGNTDTIETRNNGLTITSPLTLENIGHIRGCGGHGGKGGRGADILKDVEETETKYEYKDCNQNTSGNYWVAVHSSSRDTVLTWNGNSTDTLGNVGEAWQMIPGVGEVRRTGNVVATHNCPYTQFYKIERKYTTKVSITGGLGGEGGNGCSYNENTMYEADWRNGDEGEPAEGGSNNEKNMNGGNSGGTGGTGGWWGNNGYGGGRGYGNGDYGTLGKGHGVGIVGVGFLNIDSTIGEIDGGYTGVIVYPPIDPSKFTWYTLAPNSTGWDSNVNGNIIKTDPTKAVYGEFPGADSIQDGDVFASNHIHLEGNQSITIPPTDTLTESVTYYSVADRSFKTVGYTSSGLGDNLVHNGDFSNGFDGWTPGTGETFDWSIATPDGAQLDLRVRGDYAICHANLISTIPAGEMFRLSYSTEIVDDKGHLAENLFGVQLNVNEIEKWTREGDHEYILSHTNDVVKVKMSRAGADFTGIWRNIEIRKIIEFTLDESCSSILKLNKIITDDDITYLNANPNCIIDMLNDTPHSSLTFDKNDIINGGGYYPCDEGASGNKYIKNIVDDSQIEINEYTTKCRTELVNTREGANALRIIKGGVSTVDKPRGFPWASVTVPFDSDTWASNSDLIERLGNINVNAVGIHFDFTKVMDKYKIDRADAIALAFSSADTMIGEIQAYNQTHGRDIVVKIKVESTPHDSAECQNRTAPAFWADDAPCRAEMMTFITEFVQHFSQFDEVVYYKFIAEPRYYPKYPILSPVESPPNWGGENGTLAEMIATTRAVDTNCWIGLSLCKGGNPLNQDPNADPYPDDKIIYTYSNWIPFAYTVQGISGASYPVTYPGNISSEGATSWWDIDKIRETFADVITFQQTNNVLISASIGAIRFAPGKDKFIEDVATVYKENGFGRASFDGASSTSAPYKGFNIFYDGTYPSTWTYRGAASSTAILMTEINKDTLDRVEATGDYENITTNLARFDGTGQTINTRTTANGNSFDFTMMVAFTLPENRAMDWRYMIGSSGSNKIALSYNTSIGNSKMKLSIGKHIQEIDFSPVLAVNALCVVYDTATSSLKISVDGATLTAGEDIVFDGVTGEICIGAETLAGNNSYAGYLVGGAVFSPTKADDADCQNFWNSVKNVALPTLPLTVDDGTTVLTADDGTTILTT